tara:strand:+ start:408 stop:1397 length:990 start_codon:yes stop_codon:yes gene_type:complete
MRHKAWNKYKDGIDLGRVGTFNVESDDFDYFSSESITSDTDSNSYESDAITNMSIEVVESVIDSIVNKVKPTRTNDKYSSRLAKRKTLTQRNNDLIARLKKLEDEVSEMSIKTDYIDTYTMNESNVSMICKDDPMGAPLSLIEVNKEKLKLGDILFIQGVAVPLKIGIYIGNFRVMCVIENVTLGSFFIPVKTEPIILPLDTFNKNGSYLLIERSGLVDGITEDVLLSRLKHHSTFDYHALFSNSEHFVNLIRYGFSDSSLVRNRITFSVIFVCGGICIICMHNPLTLCVAGLLGGTVIGLNLLKSVIVSNNKQTVYFMIKYKVKQDAI